MSRPITPRQVSLSDAYENSPLKLFLDIDKKDITQRPNIPRMEIIDE